MKKTTILSVMAVLWPFTNKENGQRTKDKSANQKAYLLLTLCCCLFNGYLMAQQIKPLQLGDKLPETFWQQEYAVYKNGLSTKQNLLAYKGKLLILDFWATWCSTCYHKFPYLDSLVKVRGERLGVVLVNTLNTGDNVEKIKASLKRVTEGKNFVLPSIYNDQYLAQLFPHHMLSHYVWINKQGIVVAITGSDFLNDSNIDLSIARFTKP